MKLQEFEDYTIGLVDAINGDCTIKYGKKRDDYFEYNTLGNNAVGQDYVLETNKIHINNLENKKELIDSLDEALLHLLSEEGKQYAFSIKIEIVAKKRGDDA